MDIKTIINNVKKTSDKYNSMILWKISNLPEAMSFFPNSKHMTSLEQSWDKAEVAIGELRKEFSWLINVAHQEASEAIREFEDLFKNQNGVFVLPFANGNREYHSIGHIIIFGKPDEQYGTLVAFYPEHECGEDRLIFSFQEDGSIIFEVDDL
ncbi:MAG TPA: hypothetical protein VFM18_20295 [Methanosarcina sp.]|nr:hypothetical protein [Methanosarcina sp.]